jgi:uncharacterized protein YukE
MYGRYALEWELVGGDPTPGDPAAYSTLSGFFDGTAQTASEAASRLRALALNADDSVWRGEAADAFREDLGDLPKKLDQLYNSYHEASEALRIYGVSLRQLQARADGELQNAVAADEEMRRQVDSLLESMTTGGLPSSLPAPAGPGPTTIGPVPPSMGPAAGCGPDGAEDARARLAAARSAVEQIRQEREAEEGKVVAKLDHASDIGIHNKGLLDRIGGWVGDRISDLDELHHRMLRAIGDLADRISDIVTVVAVALVVVAAVAALAVFVVGSGGFAGAVMAGAWSAGGSGFLLAGWAKLVSVGAKTGSKLAYNDPDLSWSQLVKDGALAGLAVAGGPVKAAKALRGHRYFQAAAWRMGELALSGNRVARFSIRAGQFAGAGAGRYQGIHDKILGTREAPTLAGMVHKGWSKSEKVWHKHKDDPLAIFTDPIQTSPGEWKEPDGSGVWIRDFGRAIVQL